LRLEIHPGLLRIQSSTTLLFSDYRFTAACLSRSVLQLSGAINQSIDRSIIRLLITEKSDQWFTENEVKTESEVIKVNNKNKTS